MSAIHHLTRSVVAALHELLSDGRSSASFAALFVRLYETDPLPWRLGGTTLPDARVLARLMSRPGGPVRQRFFSIPSPGSYALTSHGRAFAKKPVLQVKRIRLHPGTRAHAVFAVIRASPVLSALFPDARTHARNAAARWPRLELAPYYERMAGWFTLPDNADAASAIQDSEKFAEDWINRMLYRQHRERIRNLAPTPVTATEATPSSADQPKSDAA